MHCLKGFNLAIHAALFTVRYNAKHPDYLQSLYQAFQGSLTLNPGGEALRNRPKQLIQLYNKLISAGYPADFLKHQ